MRRRDVWTDPLRSFVVTLGWILGKPFALYFDPLVTIVLALSGESSRYRHDYIVHSLHFYVVATVNYVVQDGKSNWLEGIILICAYRPSLTRYSCLAL